MSATPYNHSPSGSVKVALYIGSTKCQHGLDLMDQILTEGEKINATLEKTVNICMELFSKLLLSPTSFVVHK